MQIIRCVLISLFVSQLVCFNSDGEQVLLSPENTTDVPKTVQLVDNSRELLGSATAEITNKNHSQPLKVSYLPKCCPHGFIINAKDECEKLKSTDQVHVVEPKILRSVKEFTWNPADREMKLVRSNGTHTAITRTHSTCTFPKSKPLNQLFYAEASRNITPRFQVPTGRHNETRFYISFYYENYWDLGYRVAHYCVDVKRSESYGLTHYDTYAFYCMPPSPVSGHYPAMLYISSVGLLLTFVMYFLTPTKGAARILSPGGAGPRSGLKGRKPTMAGLLTGRNLLCHISSLFIGFICLAIAQQGVFETGERGCIAIGYLFYVTTLASFTWLTIYCFDYFWMFRGSFKVSNSLLFIPYSLLGWGIPIVALIIALIGQFYPAANFPNAMNPNMGLLRCSFGNEVSSLIYFYAPISFLLSLNIAFFITLVLNPNLMQCRRKNTGGGPKLRSTKTKEGEKHQQDLKMAAKLFLITGVPWVFEILAWLPTFLAYESGEDVKEKYRVLYYVFEVLNLVDALRGVIVFVLFVLLQRDVRAQLLIQWKRIVTEVAVLPKSDAGKSISISSQRNANSEVSNSTNSANNASSKRSAESGKRPNVSLSSKPYPHSSDSVEVKDTHKSTSRQSSSSSKEPNTSTSTLSLDYDPYSFDPAEVTVL